MAKQTYALEPGGPKRLEISWKYGFKDTTITFDGAPVGVIDPVNKRHSFIVYFPIIRMKSFNRYFAPDPIIGCCMQSLMLCCNPNRFASIEQGVEAGFVISH